MVTPNLRGRGGGGGNTALLPVLHGFGDLLADADRYPRLAPRADFRRTLRERLVAEAAILAAKRAQPAEKAPRKRRPRGGGFRLAAFGAGLSLAGGGVALAAHSLVSRAPVAASHTVTHPRPGTPAAAHNQGSAAPLATGGQPAGTNAAALPAPQAASQPSPGPTAAASPSPAAATGIPPVAATAPSPEPSVMSPDPAADGALAANGSSALPLGSNSDVRQELGGLLRPSVTPSPAADPTASPGAASAAPSPAPSANSKHPETNSRHPETLRSRLR
jgi:hypothetical protein